MYKEDPKVTWFKAELKAYFHAQPIIKDLKDQLEVLDSRMGYHSPNLTGERGVPQSRDDKLAKYITLREKYEKQLELINSQYERITAIIRLIDDEERQSILDVYSARTRFEDEAEKRCYTSEALKKRFAKAILNAVNAYLGHG